MNQPHLSRISLCGYRHLLAGSTLERKQALLECGRNLCGSSFTERLFVDIDLFRNTGLAALDVDVRRNLLEWYGAQQSNPCAQEITAWLRGEYTFDPLCLTT